MPAVAKCQYDERGELIVPKDGAVRRALRSPAINPRDGRPTFTSGREDGQPDFFVGYVHAFEMAVAGVDAEQARERGRAKLRRFFQMGESHVGFRKLDVRSREGSTPVNGNTVVTYQILYAVERRTHKPESPYAGSSRGRRAPSMF